MPIYLNRKTTKRLPKGKRRTHPMRPPRRTYLEVRRTIAQSMRRIVEDIENLLPWLEGEATPAQAAQVLKALQERWRDVYGERAGRLASRWVEEISGESRERLEKSIARSLGIDMSTIFDDQAVRDAAALMGTEARNLIVSIPEEYLAKVQQAITHNYMQLPFPEGRSLTEHIRALAGATDAQANRIARDQTSKIHTAVNQARQQSIGIEEYIWRTSGDRRVVGNPSGLYPEGNAVHGNHWKREGKIFRWDSPPPDGHPGYAIYCRCYFVPVIDVDKLRDAS